MPVLERFLFGICGLGGVCVVVVVVMGWVEEIVVVAVADIVVVVYGIDFVDGFV